MVTALLVSSFVVLDVTLDITTRVGGITIYVDDSGGQDYTSIQAAVENASDGDTIYVYSGIYYENISSEGKSLILTGQNRDNTIIDGMVQIETYFDDTFLIEKFTVKNGNFGIIVWGPNILVFNNKISNCNIGIHVEGDDTADSNVIDNCSIGIQIGTSWINNIQSNTITNCNTGILVNFDGNTIQSNTITSCDYGITIWGTNNFIYSNVINTNILGLDFRDFFPSSRNYIPQNNTVNGEPFYHFFNVHGAPGSPIVLENMVLGTSNISNIGQISIVDCSYIKITNNVLSNSSFGNGIFVFSSEFIMIEDNMIFNNTGGVFGGYGGIELLNSRNIELRNNTIFKNTKGIGFSEHFAGEGENADLIIENNDISWNSGEGIYGLGDLSYINNNNILNNSYGIYLRSSLNNVMRNNVSKNNYGIYLASSSNNNKIYHNNIMNNTNQAFDGTDSGNQWDNGYPSGGNYWSDYVGIDNFKGPDQDIPGSDGIGDTNYSIDSDSIDNYPLMEPYTERIFENATILQPGWNLISLPLVQEIQNLSEVLKMIDGYYDAVQWYDLTDNEDPWNHHKVGKSFGNDLFELNETMGFWIHITNPGDTIFLYNGTQPTSNQSITLHPGWNMVGYPSLSNRNRTAALNNIIFDTDVDVIWTFNAATQTWQEIGPTDYFELGRGYWMHSKVTKTWDVPL